MKNLDTNNLETVPTPVITTTALNIPAKFLLILKNIPMNNGDFFIAIYNTESTFMKTPFAARRISKQETESAVEFDLSMGNYSVLIFQDQNGDGILNRNSYGMPIEPWTTSASIGRTTGKPTWSQTQFKIDELVTQFEITF